MPSTNQPRGTSFRYSTGPDKEKMLQRFIAELPPAELYRLLPTDKDFSASFERQQGIPVDGAKKILRSYSPFTIEVVPPLIFSNNNSLENGNNGSRNINLINTAWSKNNAFTQASNRLNARSLGQNRFTSSTSRKALEQFTASGVNYRNATVDKSRYTTQASPTSTTLANVQTAIDIALQLGDLLRLPPLTLLINPQSLQMQYNKIQQFTERTRFGYLFQAWGEEQPTLSISGKTGAFIAGSALRDPQRTFSSNDVNKGVTTPTGAQFASKRNSAAWQNLMNLFQMYKSNGYIYDRIQKSNAHHFVGALAIRYDQWIYIGHMNSFSFGYEKENMLGGMSFDIEFTVSAMVDTSQQTTQVLPLTAPTSSPSSRQYSAINTGTSINNGSPQNVSSANDLTNFGSIELLTSNLTQLAELSSGSVITLNASVGGFRTPTEPIETVSTSQTLQPFRGIGREIL